MTKKTHKYHYFDASAFNDPVRADFAPAGTCNVFDAIVAAGIGALAGNSSRKAAKNLARSQRKAIDEARRRATEEYEWYKEKYRPVLDQLAKDAQEGVKADIEGVSSRASADVVQAFDKARGISRRNLLRYGANPGDANFAENERKFALEQAKADAGGVTRARDQERRWADSETRSLRMNASALARGMPAQYQSSMMNAAGQYGNMADNYLQDAAQMGRFAGGLPWDKLFSGGGGGVNYGGNAYADQATANKFREQDELFKADGGPVDGPGTGTSDSIPARLSDGEYVIPADVVRAKGTQFFDKLLDKHHTPVRRSTARGIPRFVDGGEVREMTEEERMRAERAREATEIVADNNLVPGANNVKRLREKTRRALEEAGVY